MKSIRIIRKDIIGVKFACPVCGQKLDVGRDLLGSTVDCPSCSTQLTTPDFQNYPGDFPIKRLPKTSTTSPSVPENTPSP